MRRVVIGIAAVLGVAFVAAADEPRDVADARKIESAVQSAIAKAESAVACLYVDRPDPGAAHDSIHGAKSPDAVPDFYATGVVVESTGKILTNYHVIRAAADGADPTKKVRIRVRLPAIKDSNGIEATPRDAVATLFAADAKSDLAVLKIDSVRGRLPVVPFGRGEDLKKGSIVVSLSHPYASGFRDGSPSASWGIVSNIRRRLSGALGELDRSKLPLSRFATMIQVDLRLNLGTSGGALLDLDGRLVGLTTSQSALTGVDSPGGFAIPMDEKYRRIAEVLLRGEEVEYGFLGIKPSDHFAPGDGVVIGEVTANSPAANAKLQPGDTVVKVNDCPIRDFDDLFLEISSTLARRTATLLIQRSGMNHSIVVTLVKGQVGDIDRLTHRLKDESAVIATVQPRDWHGLRVDFTSVVSREANGIPIGVVVREAAGPAKAAGLVPYEDIIVSVNGEAVKTPAEFREKAGRALKSDGALKLSLADGRTVTLP